jgi:hypothetical protein
MFNEIKYYAPYFNDTQKLREAYKLEYPTATFDQISSMMVGALSVYVPTEKFDELVASVLSDASAKVNN